MPDFSRLRNFFPAPLRTAAHTAIVRLALNSLPDSLPGSLADSLPDSLPDGLPKKLPDCAPQRPDKNSPRPAILDIGCGTGRLLSHFHACGFNCTGIDASPAALERLRGKIPHANTVLCADSTLQSGAVPLPFADRHFDIAVLCFALHRLSPPAQSAALAEARRVSHCVIVADYCLTERNLHYPARWLAGGLELCRGPARFRAYRDFLRVGGIYGLLRRENAAPRSEIPLFGGAADAIRLEP